MGVEIGLKDCTSIFLRFQRRGAENINLVTGTQFIPHIGESIIMARTRGLSIPVLWNSSGYESVEMLDLLGGFVDVYLPDVKTLDSKVALHYFGAPDYPERARAAVTAMVERAPPTFDEQGMLRRGTMVRHLVLPGELDNTRSVIEWFSEYMKDRALLSVMFQYLPLAEASAAPDRKIHHTERDQVMAMLERSGIDDGYVQELDPGEVWMPDFSRVNPFPADYSKVVWHWRHGFIGGSDPA